MNGGAASRTIGGSTRVKRRIRVIPTLLVDRDGRLVKTVKFSKRTYIGDPINAVKIFNGKEVDELVLLDIDASVDGRGPNFAAIEDVVSEAFMPVGYGGGIRSMDDIGRLYQCGIEKVVVSSSLAQGFSLIEQAAERFGAQAISACLPVKRSLFGGYVVRLKSGTKSLVGRIEDIACRLVEAGVGEIIVYGIDRDGTFGGFDIELLQTVSAAVNVPVVGCGGARDVGDFRDAVVDGGCSAVAAGSMFVYQSARRGVLISYPSQARLTEQLYSKVV